MEREERVERKLCVSVSVKGEFLELPLRSFQLPRLASIFIARSWIHKDLRE